MIRAGLFLAVFLLGVLAIAPAIKGTYVVAEILSWTAPLALARFVLVVGGFYSAFRVWIALDQRLVDRGKL